MDSDIFKSLHIETQSKASISKETKLQFFKFKNIELFSFVNVCAVAKYQQDTHRSNRSQMLFKIGVLKKVHRKTHLLESLF